MREKEKKNKQKVTGQRNEETEVQVMEEEFYTKVKDELMEKEKKTLGEKNARTEEKRDNIR